MQKLAFFDFCETLVNFQTADAFVDYVRKMNGNCYMRFFDIISKILIKIRITALLNKFFPNAAFGKKIKLLQLRGFKYQKLNNLASLYYQEMIIPNLIPSVVDKMKILVQEGYEICLVSAGYSLYLKYFAEDHQIEHIISTEIAFDRSGNRCLGTISGKDSINSEKVIRIKDYFKDQNVNFHESISFSDSMTDLPMLLLTGKAVVVSKERSQPWGNQNNFMEIIWKKNEK